MDNHVRSGRTCPVRTNVARARLADLGQDNFIRTMRCQTVRMNLALSVPTSLPLALRVIFSALWR